MHELKEIDLCTVIPNKRPRRSIPEGGHCTRKLQMVFLEQPESDVTPPDMHFRVWYNNN